ncbi:WD40-repeat-containing subunit of the 18S rRNA processing complex [Plasmopara halstedii]|uniref:WD40-repeat-containing subunit of the 18S rRNA processing complex n=1 Tax=Plasmopara halstedii TaxID=4781 RepID=A0A0P1ASV1_PLAHL|nr:WD40-repeat-containing subunit of the 18S rRNA processing complex [Plasmopara halstedii]CEG45292.1 WD40-repeat-containing subunit of the 18S rRNA processing complex [Plasmopara halstedii]|eukprot:XP_024581661.1 WD40-repeat-containing subunit of the 18S rRNA processing complex [Plasmopara halstedii]
MTVERMVRKAPKRADNSKHESKRAYIKNVAKYTRSRGVSIRGIRDKKLKGSLLRAYEKQKLAAESAAKSEILLPDQAGLLEAEGLEKTYKITQQQLADNVDINTARKIFCLDLPDYGSYRVKYTRNGRNMLLGSQKGHLAQIDALRMKLTCEFHANDLVRDISFLHNDSLFATAQKKHVYIYDNTGAEAHCIRTIPEPRRMEFLPYHFLLSCVSGNGLLTYHDVTVGKQVSTHRTKQGLCDTMALNPFNAVINLGHASGIVTLWTPNMPDAVVKMQCHQGPIRSMGIDCSGKYLITAGADRKVKVFDMRKYQELNSYYLSAAANTLNVSQRGLVAVGFGPNVHVLKNTFSSGSPIRPYMTYQIPGSMISSVAFRPFEDVLGVGHAAGFNSIIIPGSGEPNFDTYEANPFENHKQRDESEVRSLLEKIRPEMITLDPNTIGRVDVDPAEEQEQKIQQMQLANGDDPAKKLKNKMRGKNRPSRRLRKKQQNVIDAQRQQLREQLINKQKRKDRQEQQREWNKKAEKAPTALNRFFKK